MSNKDANEKIGRLEDYVLLEKLINTYHWRADHFDWQGWAECFTEDAVFDLPNSFGLLTGRKQIHDVCKDNMDHVYEVMQHIMVNLDFEVTGNNTATGHGNLIFTALPDAQMQSQNYMAGGRYNWEFRRTNAGWRISKARLDFLWNNGGDKESVFAAGKG